MMATPTVLCRPFSFALTHRFRYSCSNKIRYLSTDTTAIEESSPNNASSSIPTSSSSSPAPHYLRRLDVAIVGLPNAGKSQLLNLLLETPLAAVSRKRHTTREGILGAYTTTTTTTESTDENNTHTTTTTKTQLLFCDTPGFLTAKAAKNESDVAHIAKEEMEHMDYTVLVIDAAKAMHQLSVQKSIVELMVKALQAEGRIEVVDRTDQLAGETPLPIVPRQPPAPPSYEPYLPEQKFAVVLNKVDLVHPKNKLLETAIEIATMARECLLQHPGKIGTIVDEDDEESFLPYMPTFFYTDAKRNEGVQELRDFLLRKATPSETFDIEEGTASSWEPEERAEEIIREKLFRSLHKEVPHSIRQKNRLFHIGKDEQGEVAVVIRQDLMVQTKSHQRLVLGHNGLTLQRIQEAAQRDLTAAFRCPVTLHLNVKLARSAEKRWSI